MAFTWRLASGFAQLSRNASGRRFLSLSFCRPGAVVPFKLSDIGEGIRDVTIKEWFVSPGDRVAQFDNVCEVQSDKASVTITSRYDGVIKSLHYKVDEVALVGATLVDIELDDNDEEHESASSEDDAQNVPEASGKVSIAPEDVGRTLNIEKALATPAVRRIAMENNINLKDVLATGKNGRVLKEDILKFVNTRSNKVENAAGEEMAQKTSVPTKSYQKHMWKTMTQSLSIPHFVYSDECSVTKLMSYRDEVKDSLKEQGISLTMMPFFIKAASRALEQIPDLNAWLDEEKQTVKVMNSHNIGVAMDTVEGLVVPNIKNVQNLSIVCIAKELNRLQTLGKTASLPLSDLTNGTFSLSNIGVIGGTYTKPVILPPQVVIGAFGRTQKLPRFDEDGDVVAANIVSISWAADHRVVDGVTMAKFSNLWKFYVENPAYLLLGV